MNLELPAAVIEQPNNETFTVRIPRERLDEWALIRMNQRYKASSQLYVKVAPPRRPRTTGRGSQCNHLNGHVRQICRHTGDSFDDVKMHIKREAISRGYPSVDTSWGEVVPKSEAEASSGEASILVATAHMVADFLGVSLYEGDPLDES